MKWNRHLVACLLVLCLLTGLLPIPASATAIDAEYGEAKYSFIALDAYSRMPAFHNGVIIAANAEGTYGLLNPDEQEALPFQYEYMKYLKSDYYIAETEYETRVINSKGETLLGPFGGFEGIRNGVIRFYNGQWPDISYTYYTVDLIPSNEAVYLRSPFDDGPTPVELEVYDGSTYYHTDGHSEYDCYMVWKGNQYGILNGRFETLIPLQEYYINVYREDNGKNVFVLGGSGNEYGIVDYAGRTLFPVGSFSYFYPNGNGSLLLSAGNESGVMDFDGNWLLPLGRYQSIGNKNPDGYISAVTYNGYNGYAFWAPFTNIVSRLFRDGALVQTINNQWVRTYSNNRYLRFSSDGRLYGLMSMDGNVLLSESYSSINIESLDNLGNFTAYNYDSDNNSQYYLFDESFHQVFDRPFRSIRLMYENDCYMVYDGTFYGILRPNGEYAIPMRYKSIDYLGNELYRVYDGSFYGILRMGGNQIVPLSYQEIKGGWSYTPYIELYNGESYSLANTSGSIIIPHATGSFEVLETWFSNYFRSSFSYVKQQAEEYSDYYGSVFTICTSNRENENTDMTTHYIDLDDGSYLGELPYCASNINASGCFAYWDAERDSYGFGHLTQSAPWVKTYRGELTATASDGVIMTSVQFHQAMSSELVLIALYSSSGRMTDILQVSRDAPYWTVEIEFPDDSSAVCAKVFLLDGETMAPLSSAFITDIRR